jgi:hypothetical protein
VLHISDKQHPAYACNPGNLSLVTLGCLCIAASGSLLSLSTLHRLWRVERYWIAEHPGLYLAPFYTQSGLVRFIRVTLKGNIRRTYTDYTGDVPEPSVRVQISVRLKSTRTDESVTGTATLSSPSRHRGRWDDQHIPRVPYKTNARAWTGFSWLRRGSRGSS